MNDPKIEKVISALLSADQPLGHAEAETAIRMVENLEDEDDRSRYRGLLAKKMASAQFWSEALLSARSASYYFDRADALVTIAEQMVKFDKGQAARRLLHDVVAEASEIGRNQAWPWQTAEIIKRAAKLVRQAGFDPEIALSYWREAIRIAQAGQDYDTDVASVLVGIVNELTLVGQHSLAKHVAESIPSPGAREGALKQLGIPRQGSVS